MLIRISATLIAVLFLWNAADARIIRPWSYSKLNEQADAVVIVAFESTEGWDEPFDTKLLGLNDMVGQLTTFDLKAVIKGKVEGKALQLVHYNAIGRVRKIGSREVREYINTPNPLVFRPGKARYMLFLKLRNDGKFEPVSGLVDSGFSVMLLKPEDEPDDE